MPKLHSEHNRLLALACERGYVHQFDGIYQAPDFTMNPESGTYSAKLAHISGGTAPDWGTAAITVA